MRVLLAGLLCVIAMSALAGSVYKWVDAQGRVHYSDQPIQGHKTEKVEIQPTPCEEEAQRAQQRARKDKQESERLQEKAPAQPASPSSYKRHPLPPNVVSEYLRTTATGLLFHFSAGQLFAQFSISVIARADLPTGTYLEFSFENPSAPGNPLITGRTIAETANGVKQDDFLVLSPDVTGLKCKDYEVVVSVYTSNKKTELLGRHRQLYQSRVDASKVHSYSQMLDDLARHGHCCP